jgi:hypothetical protein
MKTDDADPANPILSVKSVAKKRQREGSAGYLMRASPLAVRA